MDSKELRLIKEAYASIYTEQVENLQESVEELDETVMRVDPRMEGRKKPSPGDGKKTRPLPTPRGPRKPMPEPTKGRTDQLPKRTPENAKKVEYYKDDVDIFDIVKGHLLDEGYAETEEAAIAIMSSMSEEWRQSIVEKAVPPSGYRVKDKKDLPGVGNAAKDLIKNGGEGKKDSEASSRNPRGGKGKPASLGRNQI